VLDLETQVIEERKTNESCSCVHFYNTSLHVDIDKSVKVGDEIDYEIVNGCVQGSFKEINVPVLSDDICISNEIINDNGAQMLLRLKVNNCKSGSKWWISLIVVGIVIVIAGGAIIIIMKSKTLRDK